MDLTKSNSAHTDQITEIKQIHLQDVHQLDQTEYVKTRRPGKQPRLFHSPLFQHIRQYFADSSDPDDVIFVFAPYVKTKTMAKILEGLDNRVVIVTSWKPADIPGGSSELSLYPYCRERGYALYANNHIHLKAYSVGLSDAIMASGNVSARGMMPGGNHEIGTRITLSNEDRLFLETIRAESRAVDDRVYDAMKSWADANPPHRAETPNLDDIVPIREKDDFLVSALPMTRSVENLASGYARIASGTTPSDDPEVAACVFHDLANYCIKPGLSEHEFRQALSERFFAHPFVQKIDEFIAPYAHFGEIKEWIHNNCTDVPVPSRRELTGNVQVLLEWFVELGSGAYVVDVPGARSQRIRKV